MHETGIARLAVSVALCETSTPEVLRFNPDDPAVNEAAPPTSASSASNQLPWTRRQGYRSAALVRQRRLTLIHRHGLCAKVTLQAEPQQLERIGGRARSCRKIPAQCFYFGP